MQDHGVEIAISGLMISRNKLDSLAKICKECSGFLWNYTFMFSVMCKSLSGIPITITLT
jgi:hypothetical protein